MFKKIIVIIVSFFLLTGCHNKISAAMVVDDYLNQYINLSKGVLKSLDETINNNEEFKNRHKKLYKKILKKQYKDLKYTILSEDYADNKALITVNINVYDFNKIDEEATNYLSRNLSEFYNDKNEFDNDLYIDYKLNLMYKAENRIDYTIIFLLEKKKNKWVLIQPTSEDLEKIHGIYKES